MTVKLARHCHSSGHRSCHYLDDAFFFTHVAQAVPHRRDHSQLTSIVRHLEQCQVCTRPDDVTLVVDHFDPGFKTFQRLCGSQFQLELAAGIDTGYQAQNHRRRHIQFRIDANANLVFAEAIIGAQVSPHPYPEVVGRADIRQPEGNGTAAGAQSLPSGSVAIEIQQLDLGKTNVRILRITHAVADRHGVASSVSRIVLRLQNGNERGSRIVRSQLQLHALLCDSIDHQRIGRVARLRGQCRPSESGIGVDPAQNMRHTAIEQLRGADRSGSIPMQN